MQHIFLNPEGMEAHSVDLLHLNHINKFKQVLKACIFIFCSDLKYASMADSSLYTFVTLSI